MARLKVLGISVFVPKLKPGQWRYVAAVSSRKEFAELIDSTVYFVRQQASETGNLEEIRKAIQNPHQLIPIEPVDYIAKTRHEGKEPYPNSVYPDKTKGD